LGCSNDCNNVVVSVDGPTQFTEGLEFFTYMRPLTGVALPMEFKDRPPQGIKVCLNERMLLSMFMEKFKQIDPDVLVGHNFIGFDLDVLLHRMSACKIPPQSWSRLGRLQRSK
jgi:DNA polymerase alpha subunit A